MKGDHPITFSENSYTQANRKLTCFRELESVPIFYRLYCT